MTKKKYVLLEYARAICMLMIAYDHLGPLRKGDWWFSNLVRFLINRPLKMIDDFGALGVSIFFLLTGFFSLSSETSHAYIKKKIHKIVIPYLQSILAFYLFQRALSGVFHYNTYWTQFSSRDWLETTFLVNWFVGKPNPINGVVWFMCPLLLWYLLIAGVKALLHNQHHRYDGYLLQGALVLTVALQKLLHYTQFAFTPYIFMPVCGYVIRLRKEKLISFKATILQLGLCYLNLVVSFYMLDHGHYEANPYIISFMYALAIFGVLVWYESDKTLPVPPAAIGFLSGISYSFYLVHCLYGAMAMSAVEGRLPFTLCFFIGMLISLLCAWLNQRLADSVIRVFNGRLFSAATRHHDKKGERL